MIQTHEYAVICRNILALQKSHMLSRQQLASIMGIGIHSISLLEQKILPPRMGISALIRLAQHFQITVQSLIDP